MRFTRIKLENWMNFSSVDVPLRQRAFVVGPNASGKSNFLDAFLFLRMVADPKGGGLQSALEEWDGIEAIRTLHAHRNARVTVEVDVRFNGQQDAWTYSLQFAEVRGQTQILREVVRRGRKVLLNRPTSEDRRHPRRLTETFLESQSNNLGFSKLADGLANLFYYHFVPLLVRENEWPKTDAYGGGLLRAVADAKEKIRRQRIRKIGEALRVAVPQLKDLGLDRDSQGDPHLKGLFGAKRAPSNWHDEAKLSDGTLRLFGMLWALLESDAPLLLEEPELSLHPAIIRHLPGIMASIGPVRHRRQVLVSTHSPEMLMDEGISMKEVLLLTPGKHGTQVRLASDFRQVCDLLKGGMNMADAVFPLMAPRDSTRLALFGA